MRDFVAIDSSTTSLAFAHFQGDHLVSWGIIKFSGHGIYEKVPDIAIKTGLLFDILEADKIVIESTFFSVNPKVATDLALAQGAILGASGVKSIASCPPIVWQKHIGNNPFTRMEKTSLEKDNPGKSRSWYKAQPRKLRKQRTIRIVNRAYGLDIDDDNVADAIGLGMYANDNWSKLKWQ